MKQIFLFFALLLSLASGAQHLRPGFDKKEYIEMLKVSAQFGDSAYSAGIPVPPEYKLEYRSATVGMANKWDLWMKDDGLAVISIRGTVGDPMSWLDNFYAAMVPAKGSLQLDKTTTFNYELADNPRAAVHVGWLLSTAFLSQTILTKIDSLYKQGRKEILIMGHSQGGGIAYLLAAYLYHLQKQGSLPADIRFKTYCSAGPKPGNLYFAYDYESMTQGGWAYNVVNAADWVPETPVSIQTLDDYNHINPFKELRGTIKKQKWPQRWALRYAYGRMNTPSRKASRNFRKYLGGYLSKSVKKHLKEFQSPEYYHSNDYVRTGAFIVLQPDENYYKLFPQDEKNKFVNHLHPQYLYLTEKLDLK
jgi:hypothetical protein